MFSEITQEEFDAKLCQVLRKMTAEQLFLEVPNIQSDVMEYFNNQVIEEWEKNRSRIKMFSGETVDAF